MPDTTITKIDSTHSPKGAEGQKYLACGKSMSMRLWEKESVGKNKEETKHDYETIGYVISGKAELHLEGQMVLLKKGDSWVVPKGAAHRYNILEEFSAVETTSPPAELHDRSSDDKGYSMKEFAEATAKDAQTVKSPEAVNQNSQAQKAKAGTEDAREAQGEVKGRADSSEAREEKSGIKAESAQPAETKNTAETKDTAQPKNTPEKTKAAETRPEDTKTTEIKNADMKTPDKKDGAEGKEGKEDASIKDDVKDEADKAEKIQEAAAQLPRTDSKVTSNAEPKASEPAEKQFVGEKAHAEESSK